MNNAKGYLLFAGILYISSYTLLTGSIFAQELEVPPVSTDRPSQGLSPDLVPAGSLQVENGTNVTFQKNQYVADFPESFIRYGLTKRLELRFLPGNMVYRSSAVPGSPLFELQDIAVSSKFGVGLTQPLAPKTLVLGLGIPTGGKDLTSKSYDPTFTVIWEQVSHRNTLIEEAQGTLTTSNGARRPLWAPSILGVRALTSSIAVYLEYAPSIMPDDTLTHVIDGGVIFTRGLLCQFDIRTGYEKDINGPHTLVSIGYTVRRDHFFGSSHRY